VVNFVRAVENRRWRFSSNFHIVRDSNILVHVVFSGLCNFPGQRSKVLEDLSQVLVILALFLVLILFNDAEFSSAQFVAVVPEPSPTFNVKSRSSLWQTN
jgi:hypothetical protein